MKKIAIAAAAAAMIIAAPAYANEFVGPRVEATVGLDDVVDSADVNDVTYGAAVGFDIGVDDFTLGAEMSVDNVFNRRELGAAARIGYAIEDNILLYGKAGYSNYRDVFSGDLEGVRVGGGVDLALVGPFYTGLEYRYSDFELGVEKHDVLAKVGLRF